MEKYLVLFDLTISGTGFIEKGQLISDAQYQSIIGRIPELADRFERQSVNKPVAEPTKITSRKKKESAKDSK